MQVLQGFTVLLLCQCAGELAARAWGLRLPGPVLGMLLLLPLLSLPVVAQRVAAAADVLLAHLSLLFVPVGVGVVAHLGVVSGHGYALAVVLVVSTALGLACTALLLRWLWHRT